MPKNSIVSVIIIFLNAADFLQETIESIFAQTCKQSELLLVHDGSMDDSKKIAQQYATRKPDKVYYLDHALIGQAYWLNLTLGILAAIRSTMQPRKLGDWESV